MEHEWYLPQFGLMTQYFLPDLDKLPSGRTKCIELLGALGGVNSAVGLAPFEIREQTVDFPNPMLVWALLSFDSDAAGFRCQITQTHTPPGGEPVQRIWFNKSQLSANMSGSARNAFFLREPQMIQPGDSLMCEVKNLESVAAAANAAIQVVIWGVELDS